MWLWLRGSSAVHSSFDVSVGVQQYGNGAPLQQASKLLGTRALAPGWPLNKRTQTHGFVCLTNKRNLFCLSGSP